MGRCSRRRKSLTRTWSGWRRRSGGITVELGRELDLFFFDPIAPASPFFLPKGATVYNLMVEFIRELYDEYGYQEIITPQIFLTDLWKRSGHYDNYLENMYLTQSDELEYGVKPMNCPGHCVVYSVATALVPCPALALCGLWATASQ